ncbi:MAG: hypothetical protein HOU81_00935 [Hamadaea sp.]|uniref:HdeD family acid-resistance protein n=1 Tax=Hamadaea sp. TaxID=2024425 RepID=UPI001818C33D|nr:DUF308 domain-containing protein [Hamadaea sp.]NUR69362.1 hypothetical protein [Hamadaea sp.]NUT23179.1 hypothetical protein [Hamadaea sp.]
MTISQVSGWRSATPAGAVTSIVLGLVLLVWPGQTLEVFGWLLAIALFLIGLARMLTGITGHRTGRARLWRILTGLVYLVAGIVIAANLPGSIRTIVVIVGIGWIVAGVAEIVAAFQNPPGERSVAVVIGLMNAVFGLILLVFPEPSLVFLVWFAGIWLILVGVLQLAFAWWLARSTP